METLKKIINITVMLYLVVAALLYLDILNLGQNTNPAFYTTFFVIGGILMLLELLVENAYIMAVKRGQVHYQHKINELKANLYDQKQELDVLRNKQTEAAIIQPTVLAEPVTPAPISTAAKESAFDNPFATDPVIITPGPTPGIQNPERRLPENTDTAHTHERRDL